MKQKIKYGTIPSCPPFRTQEEQVEILCSSFSSPLNFHMTKDRYQFIESSQFQPLLLQNTLSNYSSETKWCVLHCHRLVVLQSLIRPHTKIENCIPRLCDNASVLCHVQPPLDDLCANFIRYIRLAPELNVHLSEDANNSTIISTILLIFIPRACTRGKVIGLSVCHCHCRQHENRQISRYRHLSEL